MHEYIYKNADIRYTSTKSKNKVKKKKKNHVQKPHSVLRYFIDLITRSFYFCHKNVASLEAKQQVQHGRKLCFEQKKKKQKTTMQQKTEENSKQFLNWETTSEGIQNNDMHHVIHVRMNPIAKMSGSLKYTIKYNRRLVSQFNTHFDIMPTKIVHVKGVSWWHC